MDATTTYGADVPPAAPADLASACRDCGLGVEPWNIIMFSAGTAEGAYRCACGRRWLQMWADDDTAEGAAALAGAP